MQTMTNLGWTILGCLAALGIRDLIAWMVGRYIERKDGTGHARA